MFASNSATKIDIEEPKILANANEQFRISIRRE